MVRSQHYVVPFWGEDLVMRVLLVEDDTSAAESIEMMLRSDGYVIDVTHFGEDGLKIGKQYDYDSLGVVSSRSGVVSGRRDQARL